jgi:predicted phage terminase large subunit-like protein
MEKLIQSWDPSRKEKKNSAYCVGQVWGKKGAHFYLVDQFREKMGYRKSKKAIKRMDEKWPECQEKCLEDAANGTPLIEDLKDEISGIIAIQPRGSKTARAEAISCFVEAGNVWLPNPKRFPWVQDFIEECATFPNGKYMDQVDTFTQAIARLRPKAKSTKVAPISMEKASQWH